MEITLEQRAEIHRRTNILPKDAYTKEELLTLAKETTVVLKISQTMLCMHLKVAANNFSMWKKDTNSKTNHSAYKALTALFKKSTDATTATTIAKEVVSVPSSATNSPEKPVDITRQPSLLSSFTPISVTQLPVPMEPITIAQPDIVVFTLYTDFVVPKEYTNPKVIYFGNDPPAQHKSYFCDTETYAKVCLAMQMGILAHTYPHNVTFGIVCNNLFSQACVHYITDTRKVITIPRVQHKDSNGKVYYKK